MGVWSNREKPKHHSEQVSRREAYRFFELYGDRFLRGHQELHITIRRAIKRRR
jgi:hypothetical protein